MIEDKKRCIRVDYSGRRCEGSLKAVPDRNKPQWKCNICSNIFFHKEIEEFYSENGYCKRIVDAIYEMASISP